MLSPQYAPQPVFGQQIQTDPMIAALLQQSQQTPQATPMSGGGSMSPAQIAFMVKQLRANDPNNPDGVSGNSLFGYNFTAPLPVGMSAGQSDAQVPLNQGY